ncbi:hypothetical protein HPB51_007106 [Rhipicephalus microplus]|uniref:MIT domain-containing protein n=1 Tax=Rhipicephalus microplus TaxID=6941 RepID=A0A9J6DZU0_RHIMP|nr:hypothetical protein HPB51_007106 [Rhipicephalus microplus]
MEFAMVVFVFCGGHSARHEERHYGHLPQTSGNSGAMLASSEGPDANLLIRQKQHHKRAFDLISKALKYDVENDNFKELAIDLYRKGIKKLQKGITIDCSQGKGLSWERAQSLSDKMKVNLDMAKERLDFLESIVKMKHFGDDLPWHTGVARPQANQKREAWQKAAPGHGAATKLNDPLWLKMTENGGLAAN